MYIIFPGIVAMYIHVLSLLSNIYCNGDYISHGWRLFSFSNEMQLDNTEIKDYI